ncbi:alkaline phosphatase [Mesonia aestuariivivens]|uniref:Alkaline phosphatase n=1 Tax=Mesonia aestuariivivens TaxID=2796128 RepID=A0ABS6W2K7_9FLAO|nr:alkaline phosphatase [Mesonia aestuariivivens]MBW2962090.1 alkaline phosphatase [Mesonia aestuariivivens]
MKNLILSFWILITGFGSLYAQQYPIVHSHNDYEQQIPFWQAYAAGARSIEIDVFYKHKKLCVAHREDEISETRTLESLYLQPLKEAASLQMLTNEPLQLLIDVKTDAHQTLKELVKVLANYKALLAENTIKIIISGNQPSPKQFHNYPNFIQFDYQSLAPLTSAQWERVAMISLPYPNYANWNGKGRFTEQDLQQVTQVIKKAQAYGKPFRFWGTPDSKSAWKAFVDLGVEVINTDQPFTCVNYIETLPKRIYKNEIFSKVYQPTYATDGEETAVKNIILLIGDGNGLSQISASTLANGGELSLTQLKHVGLIKTSSADDFTTDSAAAGTALATGEKTYNRAIGVDVSGNKISSICEVLQQRNFNTAVITTDEITGATPSSFYAHQKDRGMTQAIASDLYESELTLFAGGGKKYFEVEMPFQLVETPEAISSSTAARVGYFMANAGVPSVLKGRGEQFPKVVEHSLKFLEKQKQPFFVMIEGAQIDKFGHFNEVGGIVSEGIDFDKAISRALQFADTHPGTLVVITADHETSGFSVPQGNLENHMIEGDFTTHDHTATMVPVFAYGPQAQKFTGVYENNEIYHKILSLLN